MRAVLTLLAAGNSKWCPLDYYHNPSSVSLLFSPNADGVGITAKVQYTHDDPQFMRPVTSLTRAGTVATIIDPDHGLSSGDCLMVFNSMDPNLDTIGGVGTDVTVVDKDTYTYAVANTGILVANPAFVRVVTLRVDDHPLMTGMTARTDGNFAFPVRAVRLRSTAYTSGGASLTVTQGVGRG
jgi:hypothetical protein